MEINPSKDSKIWTHVNVKRVIITTLDIFYLQHWIILGALKVYNDAYFINNLSV